MGAAQVTPLRIEINNALVIKIHGAVQKTFEALFEITPIPGNYRVEAECKHQADISGMIGLTQESIEGAMIVSFSKHTIFKMLEKIYKHPMTEMNKSVTDGVAEIVNIIFGVTKGQLNTAGFSLKQSLPSLILGSEHVTLTSRRGSKTLIIPFTTPHGPFQVLIQLYPSDLINL